jgi:carbonic anhydrase
MQNQPHSSGISASWRSAIAGLAFGIGVGLTGTGGAVFGQDIPVWGFEGDIGPEKWATLSKAYAACGEGSQQSPINLTAPIAADAPTVQIHWRSMPLKVENNGHTIEVVAESGSFLMLSGVRFDLAQFHFHHLSEHAIEGEAFPMEAHFVHQSRTGDLAVLGVFLMIGEPNEALEPIWANMPKQQGEASTATVIHPIELLPYDETSYRYAGSLTTPPCSEIVSWIVYKEPVEISAAQLKAFADLFPNNARPVQNSNRRYLLTTD